MHVVSCVGARRGGNIGGAILGRFVLAVDDARLVLHPAPRTRSLDSSAPIAPECGSTGTREAWSSAQ